MWRHYWRRGLISVSVGVIVFLLFIISPAIWDSALLVAWDAAVFTWLTLTFIGLHHADAQQTMRQSQALEPATRLVLVIVIITATVGMWGAIALAGHDAGRGELAQHLHVGAGFLAVFGAWLLAHVEFARYYARLYYNGADADSNNASATGSTEPRFRKGLRFPDRELVDYWDFLYFSFTIAMCYSTSDIAITAPWMRRVIILHAILSFAFVFIILGFTVSAISNIL